MPAISPYPQVDKYSYSYILTPYSCIIHFNIIFPSAFRSSETENSSFLHTLLNLSLIPNICSTCPTHTVSLDVIVLIR